MTSHGFGKPIVKSGKISDQEITNIAIQISQLKPIARSHVVKHIVCGEEVGYDIIFEFGHSRKHDKRPTERARSLLRKLKTIQVGEHEIATSTDFWIIQRSYRRGELIPEREK